MVYFILLKLLNSFRIEQQYDDLGKVIDTIARLIETEMNQRELVGIVTRLKNTIATKKDKQLPELI